MTQQQVTGVGPVEADGSRKIFTVLRHPFIALKEWLENEGTPEVGQTVTADATGTLLPSAPADEATKAQAEAGGAEDPKADGSAAAGAGSEHSPLPLPEYTAIFPVRAGKITAIDAAKGEAMLENGEIVEIHPMEPQDLKLGDFWVSREGPLAQDGFLSAADFAQTFAAKV